MAPPADSSSPTVAVDWTGAVAPLPASATDDPANAGIHRGRELPKHEIAPEPAKPPREFETPEEESDDEAPRLRVFQRRRPKRGPPDKS
jgi:hypothetical protein